MEAVAYLAAVLHDVNVGASRDECLESIVSDLLLDRLELLGRDDSLICVAAEVWLFFVEPIVILRVLVVVRDECPGACRKRVRVSVLRLLEVLVVLVYGREVGLRTGSRAASRWLGLPAAATKCSKARAWTTKRVRGSGSGSVGRRRASITAS